MLLEKGLLGSLVTCSYAGLGVVAILANSMILWLYYKYPKLNKDAGFAGIACLAKCDLTNGIMACVRALVFLVVRPPLKNYKCLLMPYLMAIGIISAQFGILYVTFDRLVAVKWPIKYKTIDHKLQAKWVFIAIILYTTAGNTLLFYDLPAETALNGTVCPIGRDIKYETRWHLVFSYLTFLPINLISLISYGLLLVALRKKRLKVEDGQKTSNMQKRQLELDNKLMIRVTKSITVVLSAYLGLCFIPVMVVPRLVKESELARQLDPFLVGVLGLFNSSLNLLIYGVTHATFREHLKKVIGKAQTVSPTN